MQLIHSYQITITGQSHSHHGVITSQPNGYAFQLNRSADRTVPLNGLRLEINLSRRIKQGEGFSLFIEVG